MRRVKPLVKESEEERKLRLQQEEEVRIQKKNKEVERSLFIYNAKISHDWEVDRKIIAGSMQPYLQYCKRCNLDYQMFIAKPQFCIKANKKSVEAAAEESSD